MTTIVITGSTRGIGFNLAKEFLKLGCSVVISGRNSSSVENALEELKMISKDRVFGICCDVRDQSQVQQLWNDAIGHFQKIDIWINNAGVSCSGISIWDYQPEEIDAVVDTNIKGTMNGVHVAVKGMLAQGSGAVYNLEGLGSDGKQHIRGESLYAMSKAALRYFDDSLALELKGTPVISGAILPGMVMTDLVLAEYKKHPEKLERVKFVFNTIGSLPEQVAPVLARKILANRKRGARIHFSSTAATFLKFFLAPFHKRDIVSEALKR